MNIYQRVVRIPFEGYSYCEITALHLLYGIEPVEYNPGQGIHNMTT